VPPSRDTQRKHCSNLLVIKWNISCLTAANCCGAVRCGGAHCFPTMHTNLSSPPRQLLFSCFAVRVTVDRQQHTPCYLESLFFTLLYFLALIFDGEMRKSRTVHFDCTERSAVKVICQNNNSNTAN